MLMQRRLRRVRRRQRQSADLLSDGQSLQGVSALPVASALVSHFLASVGIGSDFRYPVLHLATIIQTRLNSHPRQQGRESLTGTSRSRVRDHGSGPAPLRGAVAPRRGRPDGSERGGEGEGGREGEEERERESERSTTSARRLWA